MKLLEEKYLTLAEVRELLEKRKKESDSALGYEQANTFEYAEAFTKLEEKAASALRKDLEKAGLTEKQAAAIASLAPKKEDEARAVLAGVGAEVIPERVKEVVQLVKNHAKKA